MGKLLGAIFAPFIHAFQIGGALWNKTGDWGWHVTLRLTAMIVSFGLVLLFFAWTWNGFQPLW